MKKSYILLVFCCFACNKLEISETNSDNTYSTRALPTNNFDWEYCDYMPTPPGQSAIPSPWVGAGSVVTEFGLDITNDRYKKDGWELVFNTFDADAPGPLANPYFILYNKYRGLLRIYLYITTQFITTSQSLQDGLSVITLHQTSLLRFLNKTTIDITDKNHISYFTQLHPSSQNAPSPVASNKWYMFQYELEYDPMLASLSHHQIQMSWFVNYLQINELKIKGKATGSITGTIGGSSNNQSDNIISEFVSTGKSVGTVAVAGIGMSFLEKNKINNQGENNLGLSKGVFNAMYSGITKALSGSMSDLPKNISGILSGIFGLNSTKQPTLVDLRLETNMTMDGTISSRGSLPSMPISFWVPGTNIASDASGHIPLYNKTLGAIGFKSAETLPVIKTHADIYQYVAKDPYDGSVNAYNEVYLNAVVPDYSEYLIINPELKTIADIAITQQILVDDIPVSLNRYPLGSFDSRVFGSLYGPLYPPFSIQFRIEVTPKNGDSPSVIVKTMEIEEDRDETWYDVVYLDEF